MNDNSQACRPRVVVIKSRRFPMSSDQSEDGGTVNTWRIVKAAVGRGCQVDVLTRNPGDPGERSVTRIDSNTTVYHLPYRPSGAAELLKRDFEEGSSYCDSVVREPSILSADPRFAVLHVHHWTSAVGLVREIDPSLRIVYTPHLLAAAKAAILGTGLPGEVEAAERTILLRADAIIALSRAERDLIIKRYGVGQQKIHVIPNGVDVPSYEAVPARPAARPGVVHLLTVGRLARQKGIVEVIRLLHAVCDMGLNAELSIIGGPYGEADYEAEIDAELRMRPEHGLRIRFLGALSPAEVRSELMCCDVYLQLSHYESQGIAIQEAMSAGRPVVAFRTPAIEEYIISGINGFLVPPGDIGAAAQIVSRLGRDAAARQRVGGAAQHSSGQFGWDHAESATLALLLPAGSTSPSGRACRMA